MYVFMKLLDIWEFYENLPRKFKFYWILTTLTVLHMKTYVYFHETTRYLRILRKSAKKFKFYWILTTVTILHIKTYVYFHETTRYLRILRKSAKKFKFYWILTTVTVLHIKTYVYFHETTRYLRILRKSAKKIQVLLNCDNSNDTSHQDLCIFSWNYSISENFTKIRQENSSFIEFWQ